MAPTNLYEFFIERLEKLPTAAHLIIVLDLGAKLGLVDDTVNTSTNSYKIQRYDGNDLAFRRGFDPSQRTLVWVTGPKVPVDPVQVDLTSLLDIVRRADEIIDASLLGCLQSLLPNETWPEGPIIACQDVIGPRLGDFIQAYHNLKPYLGLSVALSTHSIQALVLACLQPNIQPAEFLFHVDTPTALLKKYVTMAWTLDWDEDGLQRLQKQSREASLLSLDSLDPWFEIDIHGLAQLIYFYRSLSLARVPNIINQIRGLGLFNFDPEPLEAGLGQVMSLWEKDRSWRNRLIHNAEADLELETVNRATSLLGSDLTSLAQNIARAEMPALIYSLAGRLVEIGIKERKHKELLETWMEHRPPILGQIEGIFLRICTVIAIIGSYIGRSSKYSELHSPRGRGYINIG